MARPIDAGALMRSMKSALDSENPSMWSGASDAKTGFRFAMDFVCTAPTLSPDEVRGVGKWEDAKQHGMCRCSVCKDCYIEKDYITQAKWKYCPNCGARMKGASEDA